MTAGESLATLDTTSLAEAVSSAESTVASDEAQLTDDEDSETSASTAATDAAGSANSATTTTTTASASTGPHRTGGQVRYRERFEPDHPGSEHSGRATQATASADQQQEAADLSQAETACGVTGTGTGTGTGLGRARGGHGNGLLPHWLLGLGGLGLVGLRLLGLRLFGRIPGASTTTTTTSTTTTTTPSTSTEESGCTTALEQVSAQQQAVATAQNAVATAESALAKVLAEEESTSSTPSTGTTGTRGRPGRPAPPARPEPTRGGWTRLRADREVPRPLTVPPTIASDEAAIDTAQADLVNAEQSLSDAQLVSPIAGTVASVGISVGATVAANSSTDTIVIIGTQAFETTATLTSSQVTSVKVGDTANVLVDGATKSIAGTVSQVGPVQSSDGTYSYPLVVSLPTSATGLFTGSTAAISVITSQSEKRPGRTHFRGQHQWDAALRPRPFGRKSRGKMVKVGLVGYTYTQVISGLNEGDSVVLADYAEPVPTSNTATVGGFGGIRRSGWLRGRRREIHRRRWSRSRRLRAVEHPRG